MRELSWWCPIIYIKLLYTMSSSCPATQKVSTIPNIKLGLLVNELLFALFLSNLHEYTRLGGGGYAYYYITIELQYYQAVGYLANLVCYSIQEPFVCTV